MIVFSILYSLCSHAQEDNLGSGLLIQTQYPAEIYFDRRFFSLKDDGVYPDLQARDETYTLFVSVQNQTPTPISILKEKEEVFATTIPPISNTERYILTINATQNNLKRISLEKNNDESIFTAQNISLCLLALAFGIFVGFRIKQSTYFIVGLPTQGNTFPSELIFYKNIEEITTKLLSYSERQYVIFVGSDPQDWNMTTAFGRWFFVEEEELPILKKQIASLPIIESPIFVYTDPNLILDIDKNIKIPQSPQMKQFLHDHPKNVLVFVPREVEPSSD